MTLKTTLKLATTLMAGTLVAGCASTMDDDGMQMPSSTTTSATMPRTGATGMSNSTAMATTPNPMVGGAAMMANMNIVQNASKAPNLSTLVSAVQQAGLASTLSGPGPFTVFAPTNDAFDRAPPGLVNTLMMPENRALLSKVLTYHVVPRSLSGAELMSLITAGGGRATLQTVAGETLTFTRGPNGNIMIEGKNGSNAFVTTADVRQSNGVVHVINGVLAPTLTP